jgi:hypothetical protein
MGVPMVLWALSMAVSLFLLEARIGSRTGTYWFAVAVTAALGAYLGWRRRVGAVIIAPLVSWLFAWFPLVVAAMIHDGVLSGFFVGVFLITIGWIGIGLIEMVWMGMVAFLVRMIRGGRGGSSEVIIFGPNE